MADTTPLNKIFGKKDPQAERPQAGTRFGLSWPLLTALCFVLVCAVAWAFFMGYMVGKGQNPGESLGAIAGMGNTRGQNPEQPVFVDNAPLALEAEAERHDEATAESVPLMPAAPAPAPAADSGPAPAPRQKKAQPQAQRQQARQEAPGARYDYTFQIAAVRGRADAEKMRDQLNAAKLKASIRKSGKVHLVLVSVRGNAPEVRSFREKLKTVHSGKPLQIERKPVETPKGKGKK